MRRASTTAVGAQHRADSHLPGSGYDEIIEFDDVEFAALGDAQAGVGFDRVDLIATREPSDLVRRYLFPTEKFRGEWRRHWIHLVEAARHRGRSRPSSSAILSGYFAKQKHPALG